jgi:hypothetical protein
MDGKIYKNRTTGAVTVFTVARRLVWFHDVDNIYGV